MFLIDDDDSQISKRSENCASGTNHNLRFTAADAVPFVKTFALREVGMKHRYLILDRCET